MAEAAICFASADKEFAEQLASYLSAHAELHWEQAESDQDGDFLDLVEQCMGMRFVIVVLSRNSVAEAWPRASWERVLIEEAAESGVHMAYVLRKNCPFPPLLRRRDFFDCSHDQQSGFRGLRRWVVKSLHPGRIAPRLAIAVERDRALDWLVDKPGTAQTLSAAAAAWFAKEYWQDFEGVYIVNCSGRTRTGVLGELGDQMGLRLAGTTEHNRLLLLERAAAHRGLYVLENLSDEMQAAVALEGKSSVIVVKGESEPVSFEKVRELFSASTFDQQVCLRAISSLMTEFDDQTDWAELYSIGLRALRILKQRSRLAEAQELLEWLAEEAEQQGDSGALDDIRWEAGWILDGWNFPRSEPTEARTAAPAQLSLFL